LITRTLLIWLALLALAIANGGIREALLIPRLGAVSGRALSTVTLSAAILLLTWFTLRWIHPVSPRDVWIIGGLWISLTLAFEFLAGHFLFRKAWSELLADYNVFEGRIWVLVLVVTVLAPYLVASARGLLRLPA
jgi:hypothetical protein